MAVPGHRSHFAAFSAVAPDGWQTQGVFKVAEYVDGSVWWEMRRILPEVFAERKNAECHRLIKSHFKDWKKVWLECGFEARFLLSPSLRAHKALLPLLDDPRRDAFDIPGFGVPEQYVRSEFMMRTDGLVLVLVFWVASARRRGTRLRSEAMLQAVLAILPQSALANIVLAEVIDDHAHACPMVRPSGVCEHVEPLHAMPPWQPGVALGQDFIRALVCLFESRQQCVASLNSLRHLIGELTKAFTDTFANREPGDPTKQEDLRGSTKRRRLDEDFKAFVAGGARQSGRSASSGAAAAAYLSPTAESSARAWAQKSNLNHLSACWEGFSGEVDGIVSIAPDATRLGQPAKDYLVSPIWYARDDGAAWLPPQARSPAMFQTPSGTEGAHLLQTQSLGR